MCRRARPRGGGFQFLSAQDRREGRVVMTPEMLNLQWNTVTLYPAGYYARQIATEASVKLPVGWQAGTALEVASKDGDTLHFKPIDYEDLVDSPIYAGKYFKRLDLDPGASTPVHMDIVADDAEVPGGQAGAVPAASAPWCSRCTRCTARTTTTTTTSWSRSATR